MDLTELTRIVGTENVLTGEAAGGHAVNGIVPGAVVAPGTREVAARVILLAGERGWGLVPYGGGTQVEQGFPPARLDLVLSTRRLNRVVDYQPDDMTVTVEPGLTLADLDRTLAARGQFLPLDPSLATRATVGGTVAAAASGPWRVAHGTPRDWVIGLRVVGADGKEVRGGGQVVKNVAGYDLPKLYTGSFGTLGLLTEVTFKVMPRPEARGYSAVWLRAPEEVETLLARVLHSDLQPSVIELSHNWRTGDNPYPPEYPWLLYFQFMHVREAVEWQLQRLSELVAELRGKGDVLDDKSGEALLQDLRDARAGGPFVARIGTLSSRVAEVAARAVGLCLEHRTPPEVLAGATGQVTIAPPTGADARLAGALRALATSVGASCVFPRLPRELAGQLDPWGEPGPEAKLMRGIKAALDPTGTFSPGRFAGGI